MSIIHFEDNNLKIFDWAVCKVRYKKGRTKFYAFGVPLFQVKDPFDALRRKFAKETDFNTISYDEKVEQIVSEYQNIQKGKQPQKRLAFLATKIYDMGGHTKWLRDMEKTLCNDYEQTLFLTTKKTSMKAAHAILMQTINCSDFATLVDKLDPKVKYKLNFEDECLAM